MPRNFIQRILLLIIAAMVGGSSPAVAQDAAQLPPRVIRGTVTDSATGTAVPYVNVIAAGTLLGMADENGRFNVLVKHGNALPLEFRRIGFRPESLSIGAGTDTVLTLRMVAVEQRLARIVIEQERIRSLETRGFYGRMAERERGTGSSQFVTPEEVRQRNLSRPSQLFENRAGIRVRRVCTAGNDLAARGQTAAPNVISSALRCNGLIGPSNCVLTVYLDGNRLQPANPAKLRQTNGRVIDEETVPLIDEYIQASSIVAAEIHLRAASLPAQYQDTGTCGVVLLWTR